MQILAAIAYYLIVPSLFAWMAAAIGTAYPQPQPRRADRADRRLRVAGQHHGDAGIVLFGVLHLSERSPAMLPCYLTPGGLALVSESNTNEFSTLWSGLGGATAIWVSWHGALLLLLRWWCLRNADRLMRRTVAA